jgi:hypothetical protein
VWGVGWTSPGSRWLGRTRFIAAPFTKMIDESLDKFTAPDTIRSAMGSVVSIAAGTVPSAAVCSPSQAARHSCDARLLSWLKNEERQIFPLPILISKQLGLGMQIHKTNQRTFDFNFILTLRAPGPAVY